MYTDTFKKETKMSAMMCAQMMLGQTVQVRFADDLRPIYSSQSFQGKILAVCFGTDNLFHLFIFTDSPGPQQLRAVKVEPGVQIEAVDTPDLAVAQQLPLQVTGGQQSQPGGMNPPQRGKNRG